MNGEIIVVGYTSIGWSILLLLLTYFKPELLLPFNKLWMKIGLALGMVVNPLVLGVIFFGILTPVGLIMKLFGRDELRLKRMGCRSFWVDRDSSAEDVSFKRQF